MSTQSIQALTAECIRKEVRQLWPSVKIHTACTEDSPWADDEEQKDCPCVEIWGKIPEELKKEIGFHLIGEWDGLNGVNILIHFN
jgi:hypothetical protein